ncbi:MAG: hypothetical protein GAK28_00594 [Luteibacter sp.]|uniref:hypothetical protein n=1 Tax=Luteibacter sp. TaxID=1886636 RepID=UPI0013840DBC|nr:hypothetical protein [Luteibacter sp.]KAF1008962.1 MAG: hypothetical protein GAK28_00594 [Luteibacter sp.]
MSDSRYITVTAEAHLTPDQLAECFWELDSDEQARFMARLHQVAGAGLGFQAIAIRESCERLNKLGEYAALDAFQTLGGHAYKFGLVNERLDEWGIPDVPRVRA